MGIRCKHESPILFVRFQDERPGPVGVANGMRFLLAVVILRLQNTVFFRPGLAHHCNQPKLLWQHRIGRRQLYVDRQCINLADACDTTQLACALRSFRQRALDRKRRIVCSKGRPVMELHIRSQLEAPRGRFNRLPRNGKRWLELEVLIPVNQAFVNLCDDARLIEQCK